MKEITDIAAELSKGNVERASEIRKSTKFEDDAYEMEVDEIARQAIVNFLKKGEIDNARKVARLFALPPDSADEAVKQAVLSAIADGDMNLAVEIKDKLPMPKGMCDEVVAYFVSWGKKDQAVLIKTTICA